MDSSGFDLDYHPLDTDLSLLGISPDIENDCTILPLRPIDRFPYADILHSSGLSSEEIQQDFEDFVRRREQRYRHSLIAAHEKLKGLRFPPEDVVTSAAQDGFSEVIGASEPDGAISLEAALTNPATKKLEAPHPDTESAIGIADNRVPPASRPLPSISNSRRSTPLISDLPKKKSNPQEHNRRKTRWGLPLTLDSLGGAATVMACAESGSEENIICVEIAQALGLNIIKAAGGKRQFMLPNGKVIEAAGQVTTHCSFGIESSQKSAAVSCIFHVFLRLAAPVIMGMAFLEGTETLTKHRDRLVRIPRPSLQALRVFSVGRSKKDLLCYVNKERTLATPDSGSELDLMAPGFASERGFSIFPREVQVEFADGSIATTSGLVEAELAVSDPDPPNSTRLRTLAVDFFLLDGLEPNILLGEDSLDGLEIFTRNLASLVTTSDVTGSLRLSRIRCVGVVENTLSWVKGKIKLSQQRRQGRPSVNNPLGDGDIDDQRENDYRERQAASIASMPQDQQEEAEGRRQVEYNNARRLRLKLLLGPTISGSSSPPHPTSPPSQSLDHPMLGDGLFKCDYPCCPEPPFQTQYLLK